MIKEEYQKGVVAVHCSHRTEFYDLIKQAKKITSFQRLWSDVSFDNRRPTFHNVLRNTVYLDWRYREMDIGSIYAFKNVVEYKDVVTTEETDK